MHGLQHLSFSEVMRRFQVGHQVVVELTYAKCWVALVLGKILRELAKRRNRNDGHKMDFLSFSFRIPYLRNCDSVSPDIMPTLLAEPSVVAQVEPFASQVDGKSRDVDYKVFHPQKKTRKKKEKKIEETLIMMAELILEKSS